MSSPHVTQPDAARCHRLKERLILLLSDIQSTMEEQIAPLVIVAECCDCPLALCYLPQKLWMPRFGEIVRGGELMVRNVEVLEIEICDT